MTSTLDHRKSAPLPLGGVNTSFDDDTDSLGSSVPEVIDLRVILPDGTVKVTPVNSSKQMLDLAVMLSASNRLSPANHTLAIYHPDHGRPIEFKASQMIGALRVDTVHLVNKKANKDKTKRHTVAQPFEMTNRVSVNLPKNQKTVIRISPNSTLADIFKMVCREKGLDPYKHELRHPTQPDMALNMASALSSYSITDISVVNVTAPDQTPGNHGNGSTGTVKASIYDTHWTYNSMPRNKAQQEPPPAGNAEQQAPAYMPGMTEKRKKKGIMSIFSRKKEGKFRLSDSTFTPPSTSSQPTTQEMPVTNGNKPQAEVKPQPQQPPPATLRVETSRTSLKTTEPKKPQRKKRQAPAPPAQQGGAKPLSVNTETTPNSKPHGIHSRGSSHSSGFDETNMSPLESPGGSSGKSSNNTTVSSGPVKHGAESGSSDSSGIAANGHVAAEPVVKLAVTGDVHVSATNVSRHSSMSTGANSSTSSLTRGKKKRMAPAPPPPGGSKPPSATTSPSRSGSSQRDGSSTHHSPREAPPSDDDELDVRELQMAIAEELKNEVSSCDTVTDGDDPDVTGSYRGDITLQTDAQLDDVTGQKDLLQRQKSDVAVFVDQMTELTQKVQHESNEIHDDQTAVEDPNSSEVFVQNDLDIKRPSPEVADIQIHSNSEANNKKLSIVSDSSSDVGSLSKFKFDNETDSEAEDAHNRTVSPVMEDIVVHEKKKIVPAFKLEFGEDDVLGESLTEPEMDHFESHRPKSIDVHAILNAFDKIEELEETDVDSHSVDDTAETTHIDTDAVYAAQYGDDSNHVTTIRISEDDFQNDESEEWVHSGWLPHDDEITNETQPKSPERRDSEEEWVHSGWISVEEDTRSSAQKTHDGGDEINFDNLDVTYVNPHHSDDKPSATPAHVPLDEIERTHLHLGKHVPEVEFSAVVGAEDPLKVVIPEVTDAHSSGLATPPTSSPHQDPKVKVTPPRSSLYSIISGVKSSKADNKKTSVVVDVPKHEVTRVKVDQKIENKIEVRDGVAMDKQIERQEPEIKIDPEVKIEPQAPVFTSLRDAYRNKQKAKEPETLIFPKPEPYKIPTVTKKDRQNVSTGHSVIHPNTSIQEETKVTSVEKTTSSTTDTQGHPIVYNTASLAVSRKAPKVKANECDDSADPQGARYWGPRPWSARFSADLSSDQSTDTHVVKISENKTEKSTTTPQKESPSSVIGMYSPGKSPSKVESSPKDKCTEISFSPKSEEEDSHHIHEIMEDKSISMLAHPVERKSILRTAQTNQDVNKDKRHYNSSVNLSSSANDAEFKEREPTADSRMYSSSSGLSRIGKDANQNTEVAVVKPIIKNSTRYDAVPVANTKDKAKKNLQQQYFDLQSQFSKWQRQLVDNQALLAEKNVAPVDNVDELDGAQHANVSQVPAKELPEVNDPILRKQVSVDALEQKRAAETYRRLNTPLPFTHKPADQHGFVPRPIMKKRFSYDERLQTSTDGGTMNKQSSNSEDISVAPAKISPADLTSARGALRQNSYNTSIENSSTTGGQQFSRMASVDSDDIPMTPDEVVHRTLYKTKSDPQPPPAPLLNNNSLATRNSQGSGAASRNDSRFGPKLDPREELMIAIRNASGGRNLKKSSSVEADW